MVLFCIVYTITNQLVLYHEVSCQNFCNNFTDWIRRQSSLIDEQNIKYSAWLTKSDHDSRFHSRQKYFTRENPHHEWLCLPRQFLQFRNNIHQFVHSFFTFIVNCDKYIKMFYHSLFIVHCVNYYIKMFYHSLLTLMI